jgi:hypothetical protein
MRGLPGMRNRGRDTSMAAISGMGGRRDTAMKSMPGMAAGSTMQMARKSPVLRAALPVGLVGAPDERLEPLLHDSSVIRWPAPLPESCLPRNTPVELSKRRRSWIKWCRWVPSASSQGSLTIRLIPSLIRGTWKFAEVGGHQIS